MSLDTVTVIIVSVVRAAHKMIYKIIICQNSL